MLGWANSKSWMLAWVIADSSLKPVLLEASIPVATDSKVGQGQFSQGQQSSEVDLLCPHYWGQLSRRGQLRWPVMGRTNSLQCFGHWRQLSHSPQWYIWAKDISTDPGFNRTTNPDMAFCRYLGPDITMALDGSAGYSDWYSSWIQACPQVAARHQASTQPLVGEWTINIITDSSCGRTMGPNTALSHSSDQNITVTSLAGQEI